ncbi:MAG: pyrrolo-quinoline quinone [Rhodospirillaceae bacterium]|nr:pyrrolo-quinoline quinone [Rhodospirillaceae bacterium]
MRTVYIFTIIIPVCFLLYACGEWMGEPEDPPLPGKRISVLLQSSVIQPDPTVSDLPIRLPKPYINKEWPQTGGYPDRAMHHLSASNNPSIFWNTKFGSPSDTKTQILSTPVVAGEKIFATDSKGLIYSFSTDSGVLLWSYNPKPEYEDKESGFGGGLAYSRGRIFASTGFGEILALNAKTGQIIWRFNTGIPFRTAPVVADKKVFAISLDNQIWALDGRSGKKLWSHAGISEPAGLLGGASPAIAGDIVLVPYSSGEITALSIKNGRIIWSDALGNQNQLTSSISTFNDINGSPIIDRGLAFIISHGSHLVAIDLRSGSRVWEHDLAGVNTPWVAGDFLYVVTLEGEVVCLVRKTGKIRWVKSLPRHADPERKEESIKWSGPILINDRLLLTSSAGVAVVISPYDGRYLGRVVVPDAISLPPIVADETIFVLTDQAKIYALR